MSRQDFRDRQQRKAAEAFARAAEEMGRLPRAEFSAEWRRRGAEHAAALNAWVAKEEAVGAEKAGKEPVSGMEPMGPRLLEILRAEGRLDRGEFPYCRDPLATLLQENSSRGVGVLAWLPEGLLVWGNGRRWLVEGPTSASPALRPADGGGALIGTAPAGPWLAVLVEDGEGRIEMRRSLSGPAERAFPLPRSVREVLDHPRAEEWAAPYRPVELIAFPDGSGAVAVADEGVVVFSSAGARMAHPTAERFADMVEGHDSFWRRHAAETGQPSEEGGQVGIGMDMVHAALSPDGRWLAVGDQCSDHHVLDAATLAEVASFPPQSSYPVHAVFTADSRRVALNSCHFYWGETLLADVGGQGAGPAEPRLLERPRRFYCSVSRGDRLWLGEASGYVQCHDRDGRCLWAEYFGSTITGLALSPDGRHLAVGSCSGILHMVELDAGASDPYRIGTGSNKEIWRLMFWDGASPAWWWR